MTVSGTRFVAEISANHNGSFDRAKELLKAAVESGASSVKLQTYTPESMTLNLDSASVSPSHSLWGGKKLFDLYAEAMTAWEWHSELFFLAQSLGIEAFSSPFDRSAVDFLEGLNCPRYKIASLETGDTDLITYAASTGKPLIISTGASTLVEIDEALDAARTGGCSDLTLLLCTSSYPAEPKDIHLKRIETLRSIFGVRVGVSDHTLGIGVSVAAVALGASVIEKHLTLKRSDGGYDSAFSLEPEEFRSLVEESLRAQSAIGQSKWQALESENESRRLRRSLFIIKNVKRGEIATRDNVKALRPNLGGPIKNMNQILGKKFIDNFPIGTPATLNCVD